MTHEEKVNELKALIETLQGVGVVHNRSRVTSDWGKYVQLFKSGNAINGWEISRQAPVGIVQVDVLETFVLRHIRGIRDADATDLVFQEHLNSAIRLFRDTHQLAFGAVPVGIVFTTIDERMFGDVLCHFAEGELQVTQDYDTF